MMPTIFTVSHWLGNKKPVLQRVNEPVVFISIKYQVHAVCLSPFGNKLGNSCVAENDNKEKF